MTKKAAMDVLDRIDDCIGVVSCAVAKSLALMDSIGKEQYNSLPKDVLLLLSIDDFISHTLTDLIIDDIVPYLEEVESKQCGSENREGG